MTTVNTDTLLLDLTTNDLVIDSFGNIAMASTPYASAQDVASACKTFLGECWYDDTVGVPWWGILGELPPINVIQSALINAALTVPDVADAQCNITSFDGRKIIGQVTITNGAGIDQSISL